MARVLVVDDEELYRVYLTRFLEPLGYEVRSAADGEEAIDLARRFAPQLLIVDWRLNSGIDGLEVAETLRAEMPQLQTVFISGFVNDEFRSRVQAMPCARLVTKPLQLGQLLAATRTALGEASPNAADFA